jgi:tyrosyl-tRNA synthetase
MTDKRIGAYVGIDPTASSLHVGHLLPLMSIFWMYLHGYHTVSLLGGATAKIGDPTGRLTTRTKEHSAVRTANMVNMHYQLKKLWVNVEECGRKFGYNWEWAWHRELVNNNTWTNKLTVIELLQIIGPGMRLGTMLARDTVKNKLSKGDGMSYAEFSYPVLQAWDWWHMYHTKDIQMQIGGADQYGNIVAGLNAVKYISANHPDPDVRRGKDADIAQPFGFTVPLLTTASGDKFGKTAGNAIWLDRELTSTFDLYGFWMRQADADMPRYLRYFTFLPIPEINELVEAHNQAPHERKAQHALAQNFVELIHGPAEAKAAEASHRLMFGKPTLLSLMEIPAAAGAAKGGAAPKAEKKGPTPITLNNAPPINVTLPRSVLSKSIGKIVFAAGLAESASDGHRLVSAGSLYISGPSSQKKRAMDEAELKFTQVKNWIIEDTSKFLVGDEMLVLRKGKHNIRIVRIVENAEWAEGGKKYPGEGGHGGQGGEAGKSSDPNAAGRSKERKKKKSFWSEFAPEVDPNENKSVLRKPAPAGQKRNLVVRRSKVIPYDANEEGASLVRWKES